MWPLTARTFPGKMFEYLQLTFLVKISQRYFGPCETISKRILKTKQKISHISNQVKIFDESHWVDRKFDKKIF